MLLGAWYSPGECGRLGLAMRGAPIGILVLLLGCTPSGKLVGSSASATTGSEERPRPEVAGTERPPIEPERSPIGPECQQLVTVVSATWTSVPATLDRYERSSEWVPVGEPISVVLGRSGLGWGRGLHSSAGESGPIKHEGDGRSPAGVFSLGTAFGHASADEARWLSLPYLPATDDLECVDDPASSHYNQLLYRSVADRVDWSSAEQMRRKDALYRWGVFVGHNVAPVSAGSGSCIFLHVWRGPGTATVGCTAGEETEMKALFGWLDPSKHPVIVQLPRAVYAAHARAWALPRLASWR